MMYAQILILQKLTHGAVNNTHHVSDTAPLKNSSLTLDQAWQCGFTKLLCVSSSKPAI